MAPISGQHILVTGGSGFIGAAVVRRLLEAGAKVTVADQRPNPDAAVDTTLGDLTDPGIRDAVVTDTLDGIIHLAAATSVLRSVQDPAGVYETNVAMTAGLLELARQRGVERFVLASTNAVTGDVGRESIHEGRPLRPLTPYGATKAACEMLLAGYAGSYGIAASAVRFTNVYGLGMAHKDSFVPRLMRAALGGTGVEVYGDGEQQRDLVHSDDLVAALLLAWQRRHVGPLIVGSGASVTVNRLVTEARAVTGAPIPATHVAPKPGEMPAVIVDTSLARSLGWAPRVSLRDGLAGVWADFRSRAAVAAPAP